MDGTADRSGVLVHYGVRGMRWGHRKTASGDYKLSGRRTKGSDDYERSRALLSRPVKSLTNAELQALNTRLQLEQNYSSLTGSNKNVVQRGHTQLKTAVDMATTVDRAYKIATGPVGKAVQSAIAAAWERR